MLDKINKFIKINNYYILIFNIM